MGACCASTAAARDDWRPVRESSTGDGCFTLKHGIATDFTSDSHQGYARHDGKGEDDHHEPRVDAAPEPDNNSPCCPGNDDGAAASDRDTSHHCYLLDFGGANRSPEAACQTCYRAR